MTDYAALKADIAANGIRVPIVVDVHGHILDGHHRAAIAKELGIHLPKLLEGGQHLPGFFCVRDGLEYDVRTHPIHVEDSGSHPLLSRADTLLIRQQWLAGKLDPPCPVCPAGPGMWCLNPTGGENAPRTHDERLAL